MREHLITGVFPLGASGVGVTFDANKFTQALHDRMTQEFCDRLDEQTRGLSGEDAASRAEEFAREADRQLCADALAVDRGGILRAWGLRDFPRPDFASLLKLPPKFPPDLFKWARRYALPKVAEGEDPYEEQKDDARDYMRALCDPNHPCARRPAYVADHDLARYLRVKVWELAEVPEHYIAEARAILAARTQAAWFLADRVKAPRVLVIGPDAFRGL